MSDIIAPAAPATAPAAPAAPAPVAAAPPPAAPRTRVVAPPRTAAPVAAAPAAAAAAPEAPTDNAPKRATVSARVAKELDDLRAFKRNAGATADALGGYAKSALGELPPNVAAYIRETVGEDPAAQLRAVTAAKKNGLINPGVPGGADTAPTGAPKPAADVSADSDVSRARRYNELVESGKSVAANAYGTIHDAAIQRGLKKLAATSARN